MFQIRLALTLPLYCAVLVTACVTTSETTVTALTSKTTSSLLPAVSVKAAQSEVNTSTDHFRFGVYSSSAWVSETFEGEYARQFQGSDLHFGVNQTHAEGGLDVGLSLADFVPVTVSTAKSGLSMCSAYDIDLSGNGRWWAGPKVSVNWQGDEAAKQNGEEWYENYIIEIASSTPDELHDIFTGDYFKAEELPSTTLAGSRYRHYKIRFHSWWQFWSVRQDYRADGTLSLEPILDVWLAHGLPAERLFDGVKANIETYGDIKGHGRLTLNPDC